MGLVLLLKMFDYFIVDCGFNLVFLVSLERVKLRFFLNIGELIKIIIRLSWSKILILVAELIENTDSGGCVNVSIVVGYW